MEEWQKKGLSAAERNGYLPIIRIWAQLFAAPFWWFNPEKEIGNSILHNGTMCFLNTGQKTLGVTASHVYAQYLFDKERNGEIVCQIGSSRIEPERYLIADDKSRDLVTFEVPEFLITAAGVSAQQISKWPPAPLQEKEIVICGGFPGLLKSEKAKNAEFPFVTFIDRVSQSSEDHVSVYLNIRNSFWPAGESLSQEPDLGGMSGGPIYRFYSEPLERLELAGFIYEANQSYELIFSRHVREIQADGTIA